MTFLEAVRLSQETDCEVRPVGSAIQYRSENGGYLWQLGLCPIFGTKWVDAVVLRVEDILGPWERVEGGA